jgi:PAS domain S-box-containing protein
MSSLRRAIPGADRHLTAGDVEIFSYTQWYLKKDGTFDPQRVIDGWNTKLAHALAKGYAGLRVAADEAWLGTKYWKVFSEYEAALDEPFAGQHVIVMCAYPLTAGDAGAIFDVAHTHQFAIAQRNGHWETLETPELKQAKAELKRLNEELEQGVIERTKELETTNEALRREIAERRQAGEALRASEERYREIFDNVSDGVYLLEVTEDLRFRNIEVNPALERATGLSRAQLIGKTQEETVSEETARQVNAKFRRCVETGRIFEEVVELELPVGRRIFHSTLIPTRDNTGRIHRIVGISRDVTEHKQAEQERRTHLWFFESMDKVNRAMQGANDLEQMMSDALDAVLEIFDCDRAWLVYPCDPDAASWRVPMERTRPKYPGAFALRLEVPMDPEVAAVARILANSNGPVKFGPEYEHRVPAGVAEGFSVRSFIAMAVYPKIDKPYMFGLHQCSYPRVWTPEEERLFQEIGRRLADALTGLLMFRRLRESEGKLEEAQRIAHVGYWDRDLDADHVTWSDETFRIFGLPPQERTFNFAQVQELIHPEDRQFMTQAVVAALGGGPRYNVEYRIVRPNGEVRFVHSQGDVIWDESGRPRRMFGAVQDITERKRAEAEIRKLNEELEQRVQQRTAQLEAANQELDAFGYSVSHDLRAPLRHINGFVGLLEKSLGDRLNEKSEHCISAIKQATQRMEHLIVDLLAFSRMSRNDMLRARVNMEQLARRAIRNLEPDWKHRQVEWRVGPLPEVEGDTAMLKLVLDNLISNALKFTKQREPAVIEIGCSSEKPQEHHFYVRDNGVGFDMRYVDKLFGVFQRLHSAQEFGGTGIGLATVRRIIHRHGGRTWAEGQINAGATFYFSLPKTQRQNH